ncbi:MAG: lipase maturation factor family protein [Candidatus Binatia bacterium]
MGVPQGRSGGRVLRPGDDVEAVVARAYHRVLAGIFCIAWLSLGWQLEVLIGSRGLLPATAPRRRARAAPVSPPCRRFLARRQRRGIARRNLDRRRAVAVGAVRRRPAPAPPSPRHSICRTPPRRAAFLSFQWDNLLLECGALAVFLPTDRPVRWIHLLFRLLLFKLYVESGIAKWQSHLGDWQDGSAMTFYYETAPLPYWPAWYAHHLPAWWHHLESRAVLGLELLLPLLAFGPRAGRLLLCAALTGFQLLNLATANYGFFVYLALGLHLFLLSDADLTRVLQHLPRWRAPARRSPAPALQRLRLAGAALVATSYVGLSLIDGLLSFAPLSARAEAALASAARPAAPWRLVNTYHLFAHITRERVEPHFEVETAGGWQRLEFWHKPGDPRRAPDLVAPHQPRVDFQLWFYGLSFRNGTPAYVSALVDRLCRDPAAVQQLFATPLPERPAAVRLAFERYRFTAWDEKTATGAWWTTSPVAETHPVRCRP